MNIYSKQTLHGFVTGTQRFTFILGVLVLSACANHTPPGEIIDFQSADYTFLSEPLEGKPGVERTVNGLLILPEPAEAQPPYPVVIMLHSSWGARRAGMGLLETPARQGHRSFCHRQLSPEGGIQYFS